MKEQIKEFVQSKSMKLAVIGTCAVTPLMTFASAEDPDPVMAAVQTGLTGAVGTVKTALVAVAGVGIGIFAIRWGIRTVMGFFKSVSKG